MPTFHPIGFWLPALIALLYLPKAVRVTPLKTFIAYALMACLSYLLSMQHEEGIGLWPFWLLVVIYSLFRWLHDPKTQQTPVNVRYAWGFIGMAIVDTLLTANRYSESGVVGAKGLEDGLMKFGLYPTPFLIIIAMFLQWAICRDRKIAYSWRATFWYNVSPL